MFSDKLTVLMQVLGCSTGDIAAAAGFDRSNISRMRSGTRIPKNSGSAVRKLTGGIYAFALANALIPELCSLIQADPAGSGDAVRERIAAWLYEDGSPVPVRPAPEIPAGRRASYRLFGERLNNVMSLTDLSNIRLSQLLHTDASLISRYRNGIRTPLRNPQLTEELCRILMDRVIRAGQQEALAKMMDLPEEELDEEHFTSWLCGRKNPAHLPADNSRHAAELMNIFESYPGNRQMPGPAQPEAIPEALLSDNRSLYFGTAGVREAVLRFLSGAVREGTEELLLYSDEDQSWMTSDPAFLMQWAGLMSACVRQGTKIRIIHNIDRDLWEMNQAIQSWLPLYMSGRIESWYVRRPRDPRFVHTLFLDPDSACIQAFHAVGQEAGGLYRYDTDPTALQSARTQYDSLLSGASPLLKVGAPDYQFRNSDNILIQNNLSLATMPEPLTRSFSGSLLKIWQARRSWLLRQLEQCQITECLPLADPADVAAGRVLMDLPADMDPRPYTPEEYRLHLRNVLHLAETCPGYQLIPLPAAPFPGTKLLISDQIVNVAPVSQPSLVFRFTHPQMCRSFMDYGENLVNRHRVSREALLQRLRELAL